MQEPFVKNHGQLRPLPTRPLSTLTYFDANLVSPKLHAHQVGPVFRYVIYVCSIFFIMYLCVLRDTLAWK